MNHNNIIRRTEKYVQESLKDLESGHNWFHITRVRKNALFIAKKENADVFIVELAALLHDIGDSKFHKGDESVGPKMAQDFLESLKVKKETVEHIVKIIRYMSFKNSFEAKSDSFDSLEMKIVQDADRLDAIGAIGIARAFNYGGYKNREIYDPEISPNLNMNKEEYKNSSAPTINHFYEKLLLLKDSMHTSFGKKMAQQRHNFMEEYLEQFYDEWQGLK